MQPYLTQDNIVVYITEVDIEGDTFYMVVDERDRPIIDDVFPSVLEAEHFIENYEPYEKTDAPYDRWRDDF